jgi:hypothetical protein
MGWGVGIVYVVCMHESRDLRISKLLKRCLVEATTMDRLVVYGSRTNGYAVPESDLGAILKTFRLRLSFVRRSVKLLGK